DIRTIVSYATAKPGVYVLLSLWVDPSFTSMGWPTSATNQAWAKWADVFKNEPKVLFGLVNEPQSNFDGAFDAQVWTAMNNAVAAIRAVEDAAGTPHHVITAQGTGGWARRLDYYVTHRIPSDNVAYEVHVYDPQANFPALFQNPSKTLPVVIGEYGPVAGAMTAADVAALMASATSLEIPHLAWTFHMRCSPNLLVDNSGGSCGVGMPLAPTAFGSQLIDHLAQPW
ncbi:MAG: cellulase family glycosylhydrolase, partial [Myxococcales bacterium]